MNVNEERKDGKEFGELRPDALTETNVAGKNNMVKSAILFMAELSLLAAAAMLFESLATSTLSLLSR